MSSFPKAHHGPKYTRSAPTPETISSPPSLVDGEIEAGTVTIDGIAARETSSKRQVHMAISLAFFAPTLVKAAVDRRLPHGIGVARLFDAPLAWSRQH
jgi:hypothetical protein